MIHTVRGFGIVNKAEIDVFLELSCFFGDPVDVGNLISGSSAFLRSLIYFEIIFVYGVREYGNFILMLVAVHFYQHHLLKRLSFLHCIVLPPLS